MLAPLLLSLAVSAPSQDAFAAFERGVLALEAGTSELAAREFAAALELTPEDPKLAFYLACAHSAAGPTDEALFWLEAAANQGYTEAGVARHDADLAPLRELPRFAAAVDRMALAGEPQEFSVDWTPHVPDVQFSPDGERFLSTENGVVHVFDSRSRERIGVLSLDGHQLGRGRFASNSVVLTTCKTAPLTAWNVDTSAVLHTFEGSETSNLTLSFTQDRTRVSGANLNAFHDFLSTGDGGAAYLWNVADGKLLQTFEGHAGRFANLSPDGSRLLTGADYRKNKGGDVVAALWDTESGERLLEIDGLVATGFHGGIRDDGTVAALWTWGASTRLHLIDVVAGELLPAIEFSASLKASSWIPGSAHLVALDDKGEVGWYDPATGERVLVSPGHTEARSIAASPDGRDLLVATYGQPFEAFDARTAAPLWKSDVTAGISLPTARPGSRELWLSTGFGGQRIINADTGQQVDTLGPPFVLSSEPVPSPDGKYFGVGDPSGNVSIIEIDSGVRVHACKVDTATPSVVWSPDSSKVLITEVKRGSTLWDLATDELTPLPPAEDALWRRATSFSPDGSRLLCISYAGGGISLLSSEDLSEEMKFGFPERFEHAQWSPDGSRIVARGSRGPGVWSATTGKSLTPRFEQEADYGAIDIRGELFAAGGSDSIVRVWNWRTREHVGNFEVSDWTGAQSLYSVILAPNGKQLICTSGGVAQVWCFNLETKKEDWHVDYGHGNPSAFFAKLSPDGKRLFAYGQGPAHSKIFDLETGKPLLELGHAGAFSFDATPDGRYLIGNGRHKAIVMDGQSGRVLYESFHSQSGEAVTIASSRHLAGGTGALRNATIQVLGGTYSASQFASVLYDPKRVSAEIAGVEVSPPRFRPPPRIHWQHARIDSAEDSFVLRASTPDQHGQFLVTRDGEPVDPATLESATTRNALGCQFGLELEGSSTTTLRVQVQSRSGLKSWPRFVTVAFD